jgi:hypothetical protein
MRNDEFARTLAAAETNLRAMALGIPIFHSFFKNYFQQNLEWRRSPGSPDEVYFVSLTRLVIGKRYAPGVTDGEPIMDHVSLNLSSDFKLYLSEVHSFHPNEVFYTEKQSLRHILKDKLRFDRAEKIHGEIADVVAKLMDPITALEFLSRTIGFRIETNPAG